MGRLSWVAVRRALIGLGVVTLSVATPGAVAAVPPPNPPSGPQIQGFYSLTSEYKGDVPANRGWSVSWQVPQVNNAGQAWGAIGQWYHNLETGLYYAPGDGWHVYYYGDDDGLAGNIPGCVQTWSTGASCFGALGNLAVGRQVTFTYEWCTTANVPDVTGQRVCAWVDMLDGTGRRFLGSDTPPAGTREMYAHDIETFGDSSLVAPVVSCARPIVMAEQRVKSATGEWTTLTGDHWSLNDGSGDYEFRNVTLAASPARWESCSSAKKADTVGVYRPGDRKAYLRTSLSGGNNDIPGFVATTDAAQVPLTGDWDGDGVDSVGYYQPGDRSVHLRNPLDAGGTEDYAFDAGAIAAAGDTILVGDWDGDGRDSIGTYRPGTLQVRLRNDLSAGAESYPVWATGAAGDLPIAGDWDGDGRDSIGLFRPSAGSFHLRNALSHGASDYPFDHPQFISSDVPLAGDWNGDGKDTVGVYRRAERRFYLLTQNTDSSTFHTPFVYGSAGDRPLVGDWKIDAASPTVGQIANAYGFAVDPQSNPAEWVAANGADPRAAGIRSSIALRPMARWFGAWSGDITTAVKSYVDAAAAAGPVGKVPALVPYNLPGRDCGGASGGGSPDADAYRTWIAAFATAIGNRAAVVVVEPDSLAQLDCLPSDAARQTRLDLVRYAMTELREKAPRAWVYLDAGNVGWIPADTMAQRLDSVGVRSVRGFALNVSNFFTTAQSTTYATAVNAALQARYGYLSRFVIDTSRNGNGPPQSGLWCNPAGRRIGVPADLVAEPPVGNQPTTRVADMVLWVKVPGDSDGPCGAAPDAPAGTFRPDLAVNLITGS